MAITAPPDETAWLLHHIIGFDAMDEADTAAILGESARMAEGEDAPIPAKWRASCGDDEEGRNSRMKSPLSGSYSASSGGAVTGSNSGTVSRNTITVRLVARSLPSGDMGPPGAKTIRIPAASATMRTVEPACDPAPKMCAATAFSGFTPRLATADVNKPASG